MSTPVEIYEKYKIPPWLQMHQLRVASVGKMLADRIVGTDVRTVLLTGFFHDMGNILKIDLAPHGNLAMEVSEEERKHLRDTKEDFRRRYGSDEHEASIEIGKELGLPDIVLSMTDNMRFLRTEWVLNEAPIEMKIAKYADLRVSPFGVVSMRDRFAEANARYRGKEFDTREPYDAALLQRIDDACVKLERRVCAAAHMTPEEINDASVAPIIEELKMYSV